MNFFLRVMRRAFWVFCRFLPVKKNKIVFMSYYGRGYGDNPKYIANALLAKYSDLDLVWITNNIEKPDTPPQFRTVRYLSLRYIYEMSTAKVWVDNCRKVYCEKKKDQYYMMTWHGSLGMKKVENMVADKLGDSYIKMAKRDASQCDVMISGSSTLTKNYRDYFWYPDGEVIEKGLPRNDRLINYSESERKAIKEKVKVDNRFKLMFYAPTFRDNHDISIYDIDYNRLKTALEKRYSGEWRIMVRLHPNVFELAKDLNLDPEIVIDVSYYPDIQELYLISDMLITDYSSVIFDFLLIGKPSLIYASDISSYKKERDYYFEFSELPFAVCENNDELEQVILSFNDEEYKNRINAFMKKHGFCETGHAAEFAADWILEKMNKKTE